MINYIIYIFISKRVIRNCTNKIEMINYTNRGDTHINELSFCNDFKSPISSYN